MDLPDPGIKLGPPALHADSIPAELPGKAPNDSIKNVYLQTKISLQKRKEIKLYSNKKDDRPKLGSNVMGSLHQKWYFGQDSGRTGDT